MRHFSLIIIIAFICALVFSNSAFAEGGGEKSPSKGIMDSGSDNSFYVRLDPMIMPVIGQHGIEEVVSIVVALQVADQRGVEKVNGMVPKIKDAYVRALYGNIDRSIYRNGQFLDITKLKNKLIAVTEGIAGKDIIQDVLIQGVSQRIFN